MSPIIVRNAFTCTGPYAVLILLGIKRVENRSALPEPMLVSLGDLATTVVQPGEVFAAALKAGAKAVIVAHNHPSGDLSPSRQDEALTAELVRLGEALGVPVLDHLVLVRNGAFERVSERDRCDLR